MLARKLILIGAFALVACGQGADKGAEGPAGPQLEAPAPESEPARAFAATNPAATAATGVLQVEITQRMPDAQHAADAPKEVLSLHGANGLAIDAELTGAVSPATLVDGQTLRALLNLPVEEPQTLVYRVTNETKPQGGQGICGASGDATYVVIWEPAGPGEPVLKALGVTGAAPGASGSRACPMLEYRRQ